MKKKFKIENWRKNWSRTIDSKYKATDKLRQCFLGKMWAVVKKDKKSKTKKVTFDQRKSGEMKIIKVIKISQEIREKIKYFLFMKFGF